MYVLAFTYYSSYPIYRNLPYRRGGGRAFYSLVKYIVRKYLLDPYS